MKKKYKLTSETPPISKSVICEPSELEDLKKEFAEYLNVPPETVTVEEE